MRYLKVIWHHTGEDEPVALYSEIDGSGYEVRKVERFRDGRFGFADASSSSGRTLLGEDPIPPSGVIASQEEFEPQEISASDFRDVWLEARGKSSKPSKARQPIVRVKKVKNKKGSEKVKLGGLERLLPGRSKVIYVSPGSLHSAAKAETPIEATSKARKLTGRGTEPQIDKRAGRRHNPTGGDHS